ncbi:MAG: DUF1559 domain-containing protein, partial [Planctomycetaceae bacterium]|nr:DUF1559 domain-containing protein [Planctomycetaceae bacterium]
VMATDTDPNVAIFLPMILEYYGGFGRKLLPEVKDDRLVLSYEMSQHFSNHDLAYIGLGIAFLVPAFQAANEAESKMYCLNNIKQIILGFHSYNDAHDELPPLYTVDANGKPLHSWRVLILPYIGEEELYKSIKLDEAWDSEHNKQFHNADIPIYSSPAIKNYRPNKKCNYAVIEGQPLKPKDGASFDDIKDGLENTIAVVVVNRPFCWMNPKANITLEDIADGEFGGGGIIGYNQTGGGSNFGFWNWNVKMLPKNIAPEKLKALSTANGGESVSPP